MIIRHQCFLVGQIFQLKSVNNKAQTLVEQSYDIEIGINGFNYERSESFEVESRTLEERQSYDIE